MLDKEKARPQQSSPEDSLKPATIMRNVQAVFPALAMLAGVQLGVFSTLGNGPMETAALAEAIGAREEKLAPLLYALVVAEVLQVESGKLANTPETDRFLVKTSPEYLGGLVEFYKLLWGMTEKTAQSIKTGTPQAKFDFHALPEEELLAYFRKQIHSSRSGGEDIARKVDFSGRLHLLDAGGGSGGTAMAVCAAYPHLKATVADLPKVAPLAERFIAEAGMSGRIKAVSADFRSGPLPGEYDVVILRAVLQTLSRDDALKTLRNIANSMPAGGKILISGSILDNSRLGPMSSLAFSLVFLNTYDDGGAYTEGEYREMLTMAGFIDIKADLEALSDGMGLVSATKA